jgi:hypothetical protein
LVWHRPLWQRLIELVAHYYEGLARYHELLQINGYSSGEQDMISVAGSTDQEFDYNCVDDVD